MVKPNKEILSSDPFVDFCISLNQKLQNIGDISKRFDAVILWLVNRAYINRTHAVAKNIINSQNIFIHPDLKMWDIVTYVNTWLMKNIWIIDLTASDHQYIKIAWQKELVVQKPVWWAKDISKVDSKIESWTASLWWIPFPSYSSDPLLWLAPVPFESNAGTAYKLQKQPLEILKKKETENIIKDVTFTIIDYLKQHPDVSLIIEWNTNKDREDGTIWFEGKLVSAPWAQWSKRLSLARAEYYKQLLIANNVPGSKIIVKGNGWSKPIWEWRDTRVDIFVLQSDGRKVDLATGKIVERELMEELGVQQFEFSSVTYHWDSDTSYVGEDNVVYDESHYGNEWYKYVIKVPNIKVKSHINAYSSDLIIVGYWWLIVC